VTITRREWLGTMGAAGAALLLNPGCLAAVGTRQQLLTRAIPSSGELLPLVGLGSSATFAQVARSEDVSAVREVLRTLAANGGRVFDTAPGYGASEEVAGQIAQELGIADQLFWATKLNVAGRGGGAADPAAARAQLETSFRRIGRDTIDLVQIHNMGDIRTQLPILREYKERGRIRYLGVTTTSAGQYGEMIELMRNEPIDFIGTDYAVDNRDAERVILPLARERRIGVLVYAPFGRTRLWQRVAGREVPEWAREFDAHSWAQFFLKYVAAHPAVTAITPATSRPANMEDNLGGARGRLPDAEALQRMRAYVDALPAA
jgi:aryl-alcohol dehydrogenase-like predicted oxidoreductase